MILGAVGSFISSVGSSAMNATSAVVEEAASLVEAHPAIALVAAGVAAYELYNNNPSHLGNSVDTKA